ncbi:Calcium ion binding [Gossypium australe]|uniref:Calcium ion binding n=1 Tax=Gossypium australe TaxID=47621 RepID=A0A5B6VR59_9ROSI|nr:Calcium ion binding [Gossypium australe]
MRKPTKESELNTEPIGQNLIKLISNLCFSVFVLSVLIFTAIAITYQPPDPWLESAPSLTKLFTQTENATFKIDDSIVKTGEDLVSSPVPAIPPALAPNPITETDDSIVKTAPNPVTKTNDSVVRTGPAPAPATSPALPPTPIVETEAKTPKSDCGELKHVNCSDPRVLLAIKKFNSKTFKSIVILEYQTPVNGSKPDECDVAWRFRNKKERSWRKYRDFRRFEFGIGVNCTYRVIHTGRWHSGVNARRPWIRPNPKFTRPIRDEEINDTIPTLPETNFRKGKYLYYARGGDYCKGMNHYLWSFLCGLGEAVYLNRTFVMDLNMCLSATHSSSHKDEEGKDFRFYFDFEHLKETASVVEETEFLRDWKKWDKGHKRKVPLKKIKSYKTTPMQLKKDKSTIIRRQFDGPEPDNYWYRVCEGQAAKYIHRPWHTIWKSKRLMNIVTEISGRMDWDFDAIHVIRGEKAQNKQLWPNLDSDTSPNAILTKLQQLVQPWRNLYVATNEPFYNYFDNLRSHYKVHLLDDYKELWNEASEWYNETTLLNGGKPVEFDGYMRAVVDTECDI